MVLDRLRRAFSPAAPEAAPATPAAAPTPPAAAKAPPVAPFFRFEHETLQRAEVAAAAGQPELAVATLRELGIDSFARFLWHQPHAGYPALATVLPRMASEADQARWTGPTHEVLLGQSVDALRNFGLAYARHTGQPLDGKSILDFGCGYGRFLRLFMFYTDAGQINGCDPWDKSLESCKAAGIGSDVALIGYQTDTLPYPPARFDFALAYSIFTHTSRGATQAALKGILRTMKPGGLLACSIRPVEFLDLPHWPEDRRTRGKAAHKSDGFAFFPLDNAAGGPKNNYGDITMTLENLMELADGWRLVGQERSGRDLYQRFVYLTPA